MNHAFSGFNTTGLSVDVLEAERSTAAVFQPLPFRYLEISHLLLKDANDTFAPDEFYKVVLLACEQGMRGMTCTLHNPCNTRSCVFQVRDLVEQIRRVRSNKITAGLQLLVGPITVKLNNLSAMEVNTIRPFFQSSLDRFYSLSKVRSPAMQNLESLPWEAELKCGAWAADGGSSSWGNIPGHDAVTVTAFRGTAAASTTAPQTCSAIISDSLAMIFKRFASMINVSVAHM